MSLSKECQQWLDEQSSQFMQPVAEYLTAAECRAAREDGAEDITTSGWYSRLSAPGYLDCTDWLGPFESEDEALESLFELYGD